MRRDLEAIDTEFGASHGTYSSYVMGFALSLFLTLIAFYVVLYGGFSAEVAIPSIIVIALIQLVVQLVYFLHLNGKSKARWNISAFIFTALVVFILVGGSLWIMNNLDYNMSTLMLEKNSNVETAY